MQGHELTGDTVVLDHRLGLLVVDLEAARDHLRSIVGPALLVRPPEQPLLRDVVVELEEEDRVERLADLGEHGVERIGLGERAREAVEHEAVELRQALPDQRNRQVIRDEIAPGQDRLDTLAEVGAIRDRVAKDLARRDVRHVVLRLDSLRLCAFAGALRPQEQQMHYFRKPS